MAGFNMGLPVVSDKSKPWATAGRKARGLSGDSPAAEED